MASSSSQQSKNISSIVVCERISGAIQNTLQYDDDELKILYEQVVDFRELKCNGKIGVKAIYQPWE
jgi:hypothetical protein